MSMDRDEFRDLTREFFRRGCEASLRLNEQVSTGPSSYTQSGDPQSYADFKERLDAINSMVEDLSMDYVDSGWLVHGDHGSLARDVDNLFDNSNRLRNAAEGLAINKGES